MQDDCTPAALCAALSPLLRSPADAVLLGDYVRLHESLRAPAHAAAAAVAELLAPPPGSLG